MNKLNLRLANIAFKVWLAAEKGVQKHWKTDEEVYSVSKWQRYLDNSKKRPKVHPTVVPDEVWQEAKKLKSKMKAEGKDWKQWQKAIEKKFSPEELKRKNVYDTFGVDEKWGPERKNNARRFKKKDLEQISEEKKRTPSQQRAVENKKNQREEHKKTYEIMKENDAFKLGGRVFKKMDCYFTDDSVDGEESGHGEEAFNELVSGKDKDGKNLFTKGNKEQLMNQLCLFHKQRPNRRRKISSEELKRRFVSKMKPDGYSSMKEFNRAKERVMKMNAYDFEVMLHSVVSKDDEEEITLNQQPKTKSQSPKVNPEQQGFDEFNNNF